MQVYEAKFKEQEVYLYYQCWGVFRESRAIQPDFGAVCLRRLVVCSALLQTFEQLRAQGASTVSSTVCVFLCIVVRLAAGTVNQSDCKVLTASLLSPLHSLEFLALLFRSLLGTRSGPAPIVESLFLVCRLQNLETAHKRVINTHHSARVIKLSAVVWRGEKRDQLPLAEELVPVLNNLMSATNQVDVIALSELRNNVLSKSEGDTTVVLTPLVHIFVGIRPQQVTEQACVGDVCRPHDILDSVDFN